MMANFQLLFLSWNLLKFAKIQNSLYSLGEGGGGVGDEQFPTFVPEFIFVKIQNSLDELSF